MIKKIAKKILSLTQGPQESYQRHHKQMAEPSALERERAIAANYFKNDEINNHELRIRDLLTKNPHIRIGVDIGSGAGWASASLATQLQTIYAIEPSDAGTTLSKSLYPSETYPNITWVTGLAEVELPKLTLTEPTLFLTGCVLSHIRDTEVKKICRAICEVAPAGSIFSLAECWGDKEWHQIMWHVRTKDWWQAQFPGWELDFHGPLVPESTAETGPYHKGIWGVKQS